MKVLQRLVSLSLYCFILPGPRACPAVVLLMQSECFIRAKVGKDK